MNNAKIAFDQAIERIDEIVVSEPGYKQALMKLFPIMGDFFSGLDVDIDFVKLFNSRLYRNLRLEFDPKIGKKDCNYAGLYTPSLNLISLPHCPEQTPSFTNILCHEFIHFIKFSIAENYPNYHQWIDEMMTDCITDYILQDENFGGYYQLKQLKAWLEDYFEKIDYADFFNDDMVSYFKQHFMGQLLNGQEINMDCLSNRDLKRSERKLNKKTFAVIAKAVANKICHSQRGLDAIGKFIEAENSFPLSGYDEGFEMFYVPLVQSICASNGFYMGTDKEHFETIKTNITNMRNLRKIQGNKYQAESTTTIYNDDVVINIFQNGAKSCIEFISDDLPSGIVFNDKHNFHIKEGKNTLLTFEEFPENQPKNIVTITIDSIGTFVYDKLSRRIVSQEIEQASNIRVINGCYYDECMQGIKEAVRESLVEFKMSYDRGDESFKYNTGFGSFYDDEYEFEQRLNEFLCADEKAQIQPDQGDISNLFKLRNKTPFEKLAIWDFFRGFRKNKTVAVASARREKTENYRGLGKASDENDKNSEM